MKLKKLELVGFKSFVDKTVLHFDSDVFAIVGPNGCGKSNIVDAIRWCMGEQSARHLRGRSMEDVIFSGSDSRNAHDFAEVTLTFENDDPSEMPLEYRDYAELAVTRRLHRTGDSEYLINKTEVRLRDVTDLFLGTGAGTKAYSIVEQGKVGLIVSAKAEDRRLLIEEAAGITKFKARKKQAEKKMELTQQNLLRVGDIVAEIDRSLASLKRQAAKAERFVAYRDELEDLQLHEASHRFLELTGWIKLESGAAQSLSEDWERSRTELATQESELEAKRLCVHEAEEKLEAAQNESFAADSAVKAEEAAIDRSKDRLATLSQREQQAEGERAQMTEQAAQLEAERGVVAEQVAVLAAEEGSEAETLAQEESALAARVAEHGEASARVTASRQVVTRAQAEIASVEAKLAGFERRQAEMGARRDKLGVERTTLEMNCVDRKAQAKELARSVEDLHLGRVTSAAEKTRLEQRLVELKDVVQVHERAVDQAKGELSKKRSRFVALEEMHARLEGVGAGTKAIVGTRDAAIVGLVADRVEAPEHLTQALAGLLGARVHDVVVSDADRGVELLEQLADEKKGRAAIVPRHAAFVAGSGAYLPEDEAILGRLVDALRFAPEDEALVRTLVGDAVVVTDLESARRLREVGIAAALVTVDGSVLHADGRVEGGSGDRVASGMLESKREARMLAGEVERLDALVTAKLAEFHASRAELSQTGTALDRARQEAHSRELALVSAQKDLQKAEGLLEGITRRLQALVEEEAELGRAIDEASAEKALAESTLTEARSRRETGEVELRDGEQALASAQERVDAQRQTVTVSKVKIAGARERLAGARGTETRLARSAAELGARAQRLEEELVATARAYGETAAQLMAHKASVHEALDRAHVAREALAAVRAVCEELRGDLTQRETAIRDLRGKTESLREELQGHEMQLRERQLAMEHLVGGVSEKFRGLQLARVVGDHHMRPPPDDVSRARLEELAKLIERMGSVNLDAMREHAEAEERFTFYTTQKADLDKALADLTRAIQQMNRESKKLFEETFAAIDAKFREIFPRMFRGGRAELRLTNPEDMLETGIDIIAQPPGKKLSSIELMSGGEKALTAVSLIFAIFQIKPSPFCILDEVDAPLDEANVARYNEMIRSMTDRSQFILITHIKRTMQMVDVLYGVTMPESGVSKIVSVKLNDQVQTAKTKPSEPAAAVA
jgi:chromosome segregation protein